MKKLFFLLALLPSLLFAQRSPTGTRVTRLGEVRAQSIETPTGSSDEWLTGSAVRAVVDSCTGWAEYRDNVYTSGSPLVLTAGDTVTLPNNAGVVRDAQLPVGVTSFYSSTDTTILGINGTGIISI